MVVDIRSNRFLFKLAAFFSPSLSFVESTCGASQEIPCVSSIFLQTQRGGCNNANQDVETTLAPKTIPRRAHTSVCEEHRTTQHRWDRIHKSIMLDTQPQSPQLPRPRVNVHCSSGQWAYHATRVPDPFSVLNHKTLVADVGTKAQDTHRS